MVIDKQRHYLCSLAYCPSDFSSTSGDNTRGCSLESLDRLGGESRFTRGSGERLCAMPPTKSSLFREFDAPLVAATFNLFTMSDTNSAHNGLISAPLMAAMIRLHSMRGTNSSLPGSISAPLVFAACLLCSMRDANSSPNDSICTPLVATTLSHGTV